MDSENLTKEEQEAKDLCLLQALPCKTCLDTGMLTFWKSTSIATVILMLLLSLTAWTLTRELARCVAEIQDLKVSVKAIDNRVVSNGDRILDIVNNHRQLTMENRTLQSEIKGLIGSHVYDAKKHDDGRKR